MYYWSIFVQIGVSTSSKHWEMDYQMEEMRKITRRTRGSKEKMDLFRWIAERITSSR